MLVPARKLIAVLVGSFAFGFLIAPNIVDLLLPTAGGNWLWVIAMVLFCLGLLVGLAYLVKRYQVDPSKVFGTVPQRRTILRTTLLAIPLVLLGIGTIYLLYLPLSFVVPEFVDSWLLDATFPIVQEHGRYPVAITLILLLLLDGFGPFVEEVFFRGFLYRRLERKWSFTPAIVVSSALFALPHSDILGAFFFGIVMTLLYVRLESLWIPIAVHVVHNLLVTLLTVVDIARDSTTTTDTVTVSEFQAEWPWGVAGLLFGGGWFVWFVRRWWPRPDA